MNRINYGDAVRRRWWLLVILALVGLVGGLLFPTSHHKAGDKAKYETEALVGSAPGAGPSGQSALGHTTVSLAQIRYYAQTGSIISAAAQSVGIHESLSKLQSDIVVAVPRKAGKVSQPDVVRLATIASSPRLSAAFTNAFANQLGAYLENQAKQKQQQLVQQAQQRVVAIQAQINAAGGAKKGSSLLNQLNSAKVRVEELAVVTPNTGYSVLQTAQASTATSLSKGGLTLPTSHATYGALGLLVGLLLGAVAIVVMELLDERIRSAGHAAEAFGYPVAAEIPEPGGARPTELGLVRSADPHAEAYRKLRMSVLLENLAGQKVDRAARTVNGAPRRQIVLVVSASDEPSRSSVVDNLAAASAEAGQRVIVVDALDPPPAGSASAELDDRVIDVDDIEGSLEPSRLKNVAILKLSHLIGNSSQLLTRAPAVLDIARAVADVVIIEAPPLLAFHDGEALASVSDVVLVVGECGRSLSGNARRAGELLRRFDAPVLGVVFTGVKAKSADLRQADRTYAQTSRRSQLEATAATPAGAGQRLQP